MMNLNVIKAVHRQTAFSKSPHLIFTIDGKPLDLIIDEQYPENNFLGLVPTLLNWIDNKEERKFVWDRIESDKQIIPLLMCPDDCDLWCTVIVADFEIENNKVYWRRLGVNNADNKDFSVDKIGNSVEWFDKIKPMVFSLDEYKESLSIFKKALDEKAA